jgi:chaperonin GroES
VEGVEAEGMPCVPMGFSHTSPHIWGSEGRWLMAAMKRLIVVGDRVLVKPGEGEDRTKVGLYLPATAVDNQAVQTGRVVAVGPGTPIGAPAELDDEPWKIGSGEPRYLPVQAEVGDFAIFFRKAAVEITFESEKYLVVPQAAILGLVRNEGEVEEDEGPA